MPGKDWAKIREELARRSQAAEAKRRAAADRKFDREYNARQRAKLQESDPTQKRGRGRPRVIKPSDVDGIKKRTRTTYKLGDKWKRLLWSKTSRGTNPWNTNSNHLHSRYKALTINNKSPIYGRVEYAAGKKTGKTDLWGAVGSRKNAKGQGHVLNGFKAWIRHLQIAGYQLNVQAEHFRIVVGQRALRIFQLSFKYHYFYNEGTAWEGLASYTRRKRVVTGTWYGAHKSKLFETGALSGSLTNESGGKLISLVKTGDLSTKRMRISVKDVIRGVPVKGRSTYTTNHIYAGIHNEGVPKGRKPGSEIPQRQFMGWSQSHTGRMDKIDTFAYDIADRYLFDSVFLTKKQ